MSALKGFWDDLILCVAFVTKKLKPFVSTVLNNVSLWNKKSSAIKGLCISRYNNFKFFLHGPNKEIGFNIAVYSDFKFFLNKNFYKKISKNKANIAAEHQFEFLKIFKGKIKFCVFDIDNNKDVAKRNIEEVLSIKHYFALNNNNSLIEKASYNLHQCSLSKLGKENFVESKK